MKDIFYIVLSICVHLNYIVISFSYSIFIP